MLRGKRRLFFDERYRALVGSPNGNFWFMSMPLPNGDRISGASPDKNREQKLWRSCFPTGEHVRGEHVRGKRVLDVGANDGYFTIAACLAGAAHVTALNTEELAHGTYPDNLAYAAGLWDVHPEVLVGDFVDLDASVLGHYHLILFFGVLYHLENVFAAFRKLKELLAPGGTIVLETQLTSVQSDHPVFELASDRYPSTVPQLKAAIDTVGNSNFLLPNELAVHNLADTFDLRVDVPDPAGNVYERAVGGSGGRKLFLLTR